MFLEIEMFLRGRAGTQPVLSIRFRPIVGQIGKLVTLRHLVTEGSAGEGKNKKFRRIDLTLVSCLQCPWQWIRWRIQSIRNEFQKRVEVFLSRLIHPGTWQFVAVERSWSEECEHLSSGFDISILVRLLKIIWSSVTCVVRIGQTPPLDIQHIDQGGKGK